MRGGCGRETEMQDGEIANVDQPHQYILFPIKVTELNHRKFLGGAFSVDF